MARVMHSNSCEDPSMEAHRQAYNAAFVELGLNWWWDAVTFERLPARGHEGVRAYLENEHPHLLRAYEADFLANAIETAKARFYTATTTNRSVGGWYERPVRDSQMPAFA